MAGPLSFGAVGVFTEVLDPLAAAEISVLGFSTFDTDWVLVPADRGRDAAAPGAGPASSSPPPR